MISAASLGYMAEWMDATIIPQLDSLLEGIIDDFIRRGLLTVTKASFKKVFEMWVLTEQS